jgi:hypothetical protein
MSGKGRAGTSGQVWFGKYGWAGRGGAGRSMAGRSMAGTGGQARVGRHRLAGKGRAVTDSQT